MSQTFTQGVVGFPDTFLYFCVLRSVFYQRGRGDAKGFTLPKICPRSKEVLYGGQWVSNLVHKKM